MTRFDDLGPNSGLVEELYQRYLRNPASVDDHWRAYFSDATPPTGDGDAPAPPAPPAPPAAAAQAAPAATPAPVAPTPAPARPGPMVLDGDEPEPLRGAAARTVENMEASLGVPTATSVRVVPAKLLEVNRQILNNQLARTGSGKVSFTHLIAYAVLRALADFPALNSAFATEDGKPVVVRHQHVNLGLAVDVQRRDGTHSLLVPNVKDAETLDFAAFWRAYEELIVKVRSGKISPDDFAGTTSSDHEPGHDRHGALGAPADARAGLHRRRRQHRVPRRVRGRRPRRTGAARGEQGHHAHQHLRPPHHHRRRERRVPAAHPRAAARARRVLRRRVRQPGGALRARPLARGPQRVRRPGHPAREGRAGPLAHQHVPRARAPHRQPRPARASRARDAPRARHHAPRPLHLGPRPRVPDRQPRGRPPAAQGAAAARHPRRPARRVRAHRRRRVHAHPGARPEGVDPATGRGPRNRSSSEEKHRILERLNAAEAFERFLHTKYLGQKRFSLEGAETLVPDARRALHERQPTRA